MSYDNVVRGKLNLKGKALEVRGGALKRRKKKHSEVDRALAAQQALAVAQAMGQVPLDAGGDGGNDGGARGGGEREEDARRATERAEDHWTPAERRYYEQLQKVEARRNEKQAAKSHRQKIEEFNKYLGNLTEHHDIPKVGPG